MTGKQAPDFALQSLDGTRASLSDFRGRNAVLLDFWATWCPPCRSAMPVLQELEKKYASKGLKVISINQEEPPATVRAFVKEIGYEPLVLLDPKGVTGEEYSVSSIPTLVLVDKSGKVAYAAEGLQPMSTFITEREVCKALGIKYKPRADGGGARYERH